MGAINYGTSDYITMGMQPLQVQELENNFDFADSYMEDIYGAAENELNKYDFYYYNVTLKSGYYEGFYLNIENNFDLYYDNWEDKKEALKEITQLKKFLIALANLGMVSCHPGWCTAYLNHSETLENIKETIKAMKDEVKYIPTWTQYKRRNK